MSDRPATERELLRWAEALSSTAMTGLGFTDNPDYNMMISQLRKCMSRLNLKEGLIEFSKELKDEK